MSRITGFRTLLLLMGLVAPLAAQTKTNPFNQIAWPNACSITNGFVYLPQSNTCVAAATLTGTDMQTFNGDIGAPNFHGNVLGSRVNSIYFIDEISGVFPTIQSAVTALCGVEPAELDILPGAIPSDTPSVVTGGCNTVGIVDRRTFPASVYALQGGVYTAVTSSIATVRGIQFNNGGSIDGSNATIDLAGNQIVKSAGGTPEPQLYQTSPGSNDGIKQILTTSSNFAVVGSGYPSIEAGIGAGTFRPYNGSGTPGTTAPSTYGAETGFRDNRPGSIGEFFYNFPDNTLQPAQLDTYLHDFTPQASGGGHEWSGYEQQFTFLGSGKNLQGTLNVGNWDILQGWNLGMTTTTRGNQDLLNLIQTSTGFGDRQVINLEMTVSNGNEEPSAQGNQAILNDVQQSRIPFYGFVNGSQGPGATVIATSVGSVSANPGDEGYMVDATQEGTPFQVSAIATDNTNKVFNLTVPGGTFTPDAKCTVSGDYAIQQQYRGAVTPTQVTLTGCTAAITVGMSFMANVPFSGSETDGGFEHARVTSIVSAFSGGNETVIVNLRYPHINGSTLSQGAQAGKALEALANQVNNQSNGGKPLRSLTHVIAATSATNLQTSSIGVGRFVSPYNGNISFVTIPAGTLTRNGSGQVSTSFCCDTSGQYNNVVVNIASASNTGYNGQFQATTSISGGTVTLTWANAGSAGSTTTSAPSYLGNPQGNLFALLPEAEVVDSVDEATHTLDGTFTVEDNDINFATNDIVEIQPSVQVVGTWGQESVELQSFAAPGIGNVGHLSLIQGNIAPNWAYQQIFIIPQTPSQYIGYGGQYNPNLEYLNTSETQFALFNHYFDLSGPLPGGSIFSITCPLFDCTKETASYLLWKLQGQSTEMDITWDAFSSEYSQVINGGSTFFQQSPNSMQIGLFGGSGDTMSIDTVNGWKVTDQGTDNAFVQFNLTGLLSGGHTAAGQTWSINSTTGASNFSSVAASNLTAGDLVVVGAGGSLSNGVAQSSVVATTGDQTIAGNKTFSGTTALNGVLLSNTSSGFNGIIANGSAIQVASGPGCTTGALALSTCSATVTMTVAEPNTAYKVVGCTITGNSNPVVLGTVGTPTTANFIVTEVGVLTAASSGGTVNCLVIHN